MIVTRNADIKLDRNRDHLKWYTMLFISFLQGIFKERDPGEFRWCADVDKSEIIIADQDNLLTDTYLPRIITVRGPSSPLPMTFNDEGEPYNSQTGARKKTEIIQSSITFHCIAKTGPEAQQIADTINRAINAYYITIQRFGIHKIMRNPQISAETPAGAVFNPEPVPEGRLIMVTYTFFYRRTYIITPSNYPALKNLTMFMKETMTQPYTTNSAQVEEQKNVVPDHQGVPFIQPNEANEIQDPEHPNKKA